MRGAVPVAWAVAIEAWCVWSIAQSAAATSLTTRRQHLQHLARHGGVASPWAVTGPDLLAYAARQAWSPETRRSRRTTLRVFYGWGVDVGHVEASPALVLPRVRPTRPNPSPAPDRVWLRALAEASPRERLMLRLAGEHGLRRAEVAVVHRRDLVEDLDGWTLIVHGKGGRDRLVPLLDDVAHLLRQVDGYAFPGAVDGHLSPRWVGKLLTRLLEGDWTMHKLRHRAGSNWYDVDHDLAVVQDLLGHADPKTTRAYVKVRDGRLRATVNAA